MNLPNLLTVLRVIAVPFFVYLVLQPSFLHRVIALLLFLLASITDLVDGYLARKWKQETEFGKFLDPLADKALVLGAFVTFLFLSEQVQVWMVLAIVGRDVLITLLRYLAIYRGTSLRTSRLGKAKTAFQMMSIVLIVASFLIISYKERASINALYSDAHNGGMEPISIAYSNFVQFMNGDYHSLAYSLASFVPYFLMLFTTLFTIISGLRYLFTNYRLFLFWKKIEEKK